MKNTTRTSSLVHYVVIAILLLIALPVHAQEGGYYAVPSRMNVPVYEAPNFSSKVLDVLTIDAVLLLLDDPRDSEGFVEVAPVPEFFNSPAWTSGFVLTSQLTFRERAGIVTTAMPLPSSRLMYGISMHAIQIEPADFLPETSLVIENVFGAGGTDALIIGNLGLQLGAPTTTWRPTLGGMLELGVGYAPLSRIFHLSGNVGPNLGIQLSRGIGVHLTARGGIMFTISGRNPDEDAIESEDFSLYAYGGQGQITGAVTLGSISQLRLEVGYQYAYITQWRYGDATSSFVDAEFEIKPVSMAGPLVRIIFGHHVRHRTRTITYE